MISINITNIIFLWTSVSMIIIYIILTIYLLRTGVSIIIINIIIIIINIIIKIIASILVCHLWVAYPLLR